MSTKKALSLTALLLLAVILSLVIASILTLAIERQNVGLRDVANEYFGNVCAIPMPVDGQIELDSYQTNSRNAASAPVATATAYYVAPTAVVKPNIVKIVAGPPMEIREFGEGSVLNPAFSTEDPDGIHLHFQGVWESQPTEWVVRLPGDCTYDLLKIFMGRNGNSFWVKVFDDGTVEINASKNFTTGTTIWKCSAKEEVFIPKPTAKPVDTGEVKVWPPEGCGNLISIPESPTGAFTITDPSIWWDWVTGEIVVRSDFTPEGAKQKSPWGTCYRFNPSYAGQGLCDLKALDDWRFKDTTLSYNIPPAGSGGMTSLVLTHMLDKVLENKRWSCPPSQQIELK